MLSTSLRRHGTVTRSVVTIVAMMSISSGSWLVGDETSSNSIKARFELYALRTHTERTQVRATHLERCMDSVEDTRPAVP